MIQKPHQTLVLDSRLSDPQTRQQFNKEFAKKISSSGVGGPELYGIPIERLPSYKGKVTGSIYCPFHSSLLSNAVNDWLILF